MIGVSESGQDWVERLFDPDNSGRFVAATESLRGGLIAIG